MYYLADLIDKAQRDPNHDDVTKATLQVYFWDARQFEHFRTVVGRHLHRLLGDARLNGLVWLFPPDEIQPNPDYAATPAVSFVRDAIRRLEILPIPYVQTLLAVGVALLPEADHPKIPPFLHEPLSDAIPKERIYEIWEPQHHGNHQDQVAAYNQTLRNLVMTLMKVTIWVQRQYTNRLTATAPPLELMKLPNYRGVSIDGQLLILHAKLEQQLEATDSKVGYGCDAGLPTCIRVFQEFFVQHLKHATWVMQHHVCGRLAVEQRMLRKQPLNFIPARAARALVVKVSEHG